MLFSEPKIPQSTSACCLCENQLRFSALQRAENSSMLIRRRRNKATSAVSVLFSEPKIPQYREAVALVEVWQRFQCSSASRKFLNEPLNPHLRRVGGFQCSSASRKFLNNERIFVSPSAYTVSVLFSEPKIPQSRRAHLGLLPAIAFQCSSASRKFLNHRD